jgi:hypothetical protein
VASQLGLSAIGLDLNPVMVIVARARALPGSEADSLPPLAEEIIRRAGEYATQCVENDPLLWWFEKDTADWIRAIELSIRVTLLGGLTLTRRGVNFDRISSLASTFYVALFNLSKNLASAFQSSNPTWLRKPRAGEERAKLPMAEISKRFQAKINGMSNALLAKADLLATEPTPVGARVCDSTSPLGLDNAVDFVLTSPPYCTRIDYTSATRIQLAVLYPLLEVSIEDLSREMIGSIKVPKEKVQILSDWGDKCVEFLKKVSVHESRASSGYYLKTHVDYFDKMSRSISNISASLKEGGAAVSVVQDSHYKEVHNDVPSIIADIAHHHGLAVLIRAPEESGWRE